MATAKKELDAIKAGFASGQQQWEAATLTTATFIVAFSTPLVITATFADDDFPLLFTDADAGGGIHVINPALRKSLYQWHIHSTGVLQNWTIAATLLSWNAPLTFTCGAE
jgi:hypothetical protein